MPPRREDSLRVGGSRCEKALNSRGEGYTRQNKTAPGRPKDEERRLWGRCRLKVQITKGHRGPWNLRLGGRWRELRGFGEIRRVLRVTLSPMDMSPRVM